MSKCNICYYLFLVVVSCFDENLVQQWPKNTAIRVGEDRKLTCTMKPGISYKLVIWQMTVSTVLCMKYYAT